ncbi:Dabb family protein [Klenkia sp. PcliD-1-E]|uniref:Dabb family protein n=1 Tax=Klenkia sp. PcliD-1-E TaxID=2954492 RepID=UPI0020969CD3|nr:Dabb family protein [Klenkia sp. PcliD-1-E]MCO7220959.1 Dabb family protein [Klenkia sp. PcliD-1-E]
MIRNVVVGRLHPGADPVAVDAALAAITALDLPGRLDCRVGRDAGLRDGAWGFAITSDWADAEAYRAYDLDAEHNRIRAELFGPLCAEIARVQFEA